MGTKYPLIGGLTKQLYSYSAYPKRGGDCYLILFHTTYELMSMIIDIRRFFPEELRITGETIFRRREKPIKQIIIYKHFFKTNNAITSNFK